MIVSLLARSRQLTPEAALPVVGNGRGYCARLGIISGRRLVKQKAHTEITPSQNFITSKKVSQLMSHLR
jgi:hypothetical protein